jgi:hypothetical protein
MKLKTIQIQICQPCLDGEGAECHTPGCALWLHRVDLPIDPMVYEVIQEVDIGEDGMVTPNSQVRYTTPEFKRLVVAARCVAFEDHGPEAIKELDAASEAFAEWVEWEGQPSVVAVTSGIRESK